MTDDLMKRLRAGYCNNNDTDEAADRIEQLEAALQKIVGTLEDPTGGQHVSDMCHASKIARKALERKDD